MWLIRHAATTDMSLGELANLRDEGYTTVTWKFSGRADTDTHYAQILKYNDPSITGDVYMCQDMDGAQWDIDSFISESESFYNGWSIAGRTHPDCACSLIVTGGELPPVTIKLTGRV